MTDVAKIILAQSVITVFALLVGYIKLKQEFHKSKEQKVYDLKLERLKRQLSEFYGPLHMLTDATTDIAQTAWGTDIWEEIWKEVIVPLHLQAENILLTKIDLLDEDEIPRSFYEFLKHARVSRSYVKTGMSISYFQKNTPYPIQFNKDVATSYQRKRKEYLQLLSTA